MIGLHGAGEPSVWLVFVVGDGWYRLYVLD